MSFYAGDRLSGVVAGHSVLDLGLAIVEAMARSLPYGLVGNVDLPLWVDKIHSMPDVIAWAVPAFGAFAFILHRTAPIGAGAGKGGRRLPVQTIAVLLLMALAGYGLVYFAPSNGILVVLGRQSGFHSAANLPLDILVGMGLIGLFTIVRRGWPGISWSRSKSRLPRPHVRLFGLASARFHHGDRAATADRHAIGDRSSEDGSPGDLHRIGSRMSIAAIFLR